MLQTILGSGGAIGIPLAHELKKYTDNIRLVSRNPQRVNNTDEIMPVDVNDLSQIETVVAGSDIVYVTIGFTYNIKVWQTTWPPFMEKVIASCIKNNARLVFFDNVYMYAKDAIPFMTEESPIDPPGRKGEIRARIRDMILTQVEKKNLNALIARSADFYGPENKNSILNIMVADNLIKGKKAQSFGDINRIHTFTFTPDAAKATAILGNTPDAYNQEWHVTTTKERLTTLDWIKLVATELGTEPKVQSVPAWMIKTLGIFVPIMREFPEMLYQNKQDYIFDSSKFEKRFGITATPPKEGIKALVESLKK